MSPVVAEARPLEELVRTVPSHAGSEPPWLVRARHVARAWIRDHGFPTRKDEDWRYLSLPPVLAERFVSGTAWSAEGLPWRAQGRLVPSPLVPSSLVTEAVEAASLGLGGPRLVFVNGCFVPSLSRAADRPGALRVTTLSATLARDAESVRAMFLWPGDEPEHAFFALNTVLAAEGALIDVPAGTAVEEPIEVLSYADPAAAPSLYCSRSLVRLGPGSSATLVESHAGSPGSRSMTNAVVRLLLGEAAALERYHIQSESERALHFSSVEVHQSRGSRLTTHLVAVGAETARHEIRVVFGEEGAAASLDALYLPTDGQYHDHPVLVEHGAPRCTSRQRYVGIVDGSGRGVFNGHVVVRPGALRSDASQQNRNLLLSDRAEVDTRPRLEIFCDDVACAHGAAVGHLDSEALFYLRSRGIPERSARAMLVEGFAAQAIERLSLEPVRDRVQSLVATHLGLGAR